MASQDFTRVPPEQASRPLVVGITGASGFVGTRLIPELVGAGHQCVAFTRDPSRPIYGCRETRALQPPTPADLTGLDALINLAGESVQGLWTSAKKERIRRSRVEVTRALVQALPGSGVRTLVTASATGFYGDRGEEELNEDSPPGRGFLAEVSEEWEGEALAALDHGVRVAMARIGFVVSADGGAMDRIRPLFRFALGGRLGDGRQWMPWVHLDDTVGILRHLLEHEECEGPYQVTAPEPVRNADFTRELAAALHRPAIFHVPAFALRLALGELSTLVLSSTRARPQRTLASGYVFRRPVLREAFLA